MKNRFFKLVIFLVGQVCILQAGPRFSCMMNQVVDSVDVESSLKKPTLQQLLWKYKKTYEHIQHDKKIWYVDLPDELQSIIMEYYGLNAPMIACQNYYSPLQNAIDRYDSDRVQILIALGADVNLTPARSNRTPLYETIKEYQYASSSGYNERKAKLYAIFRYLLAHGANYNKPNEKREKDGLYEDGQTPLFAAVECWHSTILLQHLLQLPNINLHAKNRWGRTVLDIARNGAMSEGCCEYRKNCYQICKILEDAGASSSVILKPMPSDEQMKHENEWAIARSNRGFMFGSWDI